MTINKHENITDQLRSFLSKEEDDTNYAFLKIVFTYF